MSVHLLCIFRGCPAGILLPDEHESAVRDELAAPAPGRRGVRFVAVDNRWMFSTAAAPHFDQPPGTLVAVCPAHAARLRSYFTTAKDTLQ